MYPQAIRVGSRTFPDATSGCRTPARATDIWRGASRVRHAGPRRGWADRSARATAAAARGRSARRSGVPPNEARYPYVWFRLLEARAWHGKLNAKGPGVAGALQSKDTDRGLKRAAAARVFPPYLIFVSLYATCLRATGSNLRTSILSGWRRLFLVVT